jgi:hypothetical protein
MNQVADSRKLNFRIIATKSLICLEALHLSHIMHRAEGKNRFNRRANDSKKTQIPSLAR